MSSPKSLSSSGGGRWTVREMKQRAKKSRTLPSRLKFLSGSRNASVSTGNIPAVTTIQSNQERIVVTKSTLSIFKGRSDPWAFDLDDSLHGSSLDYYGYPQPHQMSLSCIQYPTSRKNSGTRHAQAQLESKSKSLTRAEAERNSKFLRNLSSRESLIPKMLNRYESPPDSLGRLGRNFRSNSRLKLSNSSLSQCFKSNSTSHVSPGMEDDTECYLPPSQVTKQRKDTGVYTLTSDLEYEQFYPSGFYYYCYYFYKFRISRHALMFFDGSHDSKQIALKTLETTINNFWSELLHTGKLKKKVVFFFGSCYISTRRLFSSFFICFCG